MAVIRELDLGGFSLAQNKQRGRRPPARRRVEMRAAAAVGAVAWEQSACFVSVVVVRFCFQVQ